MLFPDQPKWQRTAVAATLLAMLTVAPAWAAGDETVQQPQRLSDWLNTRTEAVPYPLGLMWLAAEQVPVQEQRRTALIAQLQAQAGRGSTEADSPWRLVEELNRRPATGRVLIDSAQGRWLEVQPQRDPWLQAGDRIRLPARPTTVAVLDGDGRWCHVEQQEAASETDYLQACPEAAAQAGDWIWVIQPDGRTRRVGIQGWNRSMPTALAPGAQVFVPKAAWPEAIGHDMAQWLAWQGMAPELVQVPMRLAGSAEQRRDHFQDHWRAGDHQVTASDWGFVGLLQTPTARMRAAGSLSVSLQRTEPYTRTNVFLQPLDGLEIGFRYNDIANRAYGPADLSGDQSYKDKNVDFKVRLLTETAWRPQVALGVLDVGGTGLFGSEYVVASKRWGAWDASLGLAWGYLGHRHDAANPLRLLSRGLSDRQRPADYTTPTAGSINGSRYFRGPVGVFGGVQYQPTLAPVLLKLELDGNDYQSEPLDNPQQRKWPVNLGLVYRFSRYADLSVGIERGIKPSVGLSLNLPLDRMNTLKSFDSPEVAVQPGRPQQRPDWDRTAADLASRTGWRPTGLTLEPGRLQADLADVRGVYVRERLDQALAVLHRDAPPEVERLGVRLQGAGATLLETEIDRTAWVEQKTRPPRGPLPTDALQARQGSQALQTPVTPAGEQVAVQAVPLQVRPAIDLVQTIGGPDGFILYQLSAAAGLSVQLPGDWQLGGNLRWRVIDNYGKFKYDGPSLLPRVRTQVREYLTTSRVTVEQLALRRTGWLGGNHFYALYGGYFESMFGGIGAEWLYRRGGSPWAVGIDVNRVRQRAFEQDFSFRDYRITTGHLTLHWDSGWNGVSAHVSAGQYLAGDRGVTVLLQRTFANGVAMSAFATKTNVSSAQFGEGSFDKGLLLTLPFDVFLPRSTNVVGNVLWRPLTRDGGAMLSRPVDLFSTTRLLDREVLQRRAAPHADDEVLPDDRHDWRAGSDR